MQQPADFLGSAPITRLSGRHPDKERGRLLPSRVVPGRQGIGWNWYTRADIVEFYLFAWAVAARGSSLTSIDDRQGQDREKTAC